LKAIATPSFGRDDAGHGFGSTDHRGVPAMVRVSEKTRLGLAHVAEKTRVGLAHAAEKTPAGAWLMLLRKPVQKRLKFAGDDMASARETIAAIEVSVAAEYITAEGTPAVLRKLDQIVATLWRLTHR
jgi:hypothetical protein